MHGRFEFPNVEQLRFPWLSGSVKCLTPGFDSHNPAFLSKIPSPQQPFNMLLWYFRLTLFQNVQHCPTEMSEGIPTSVSQATNQYFSDGQRKESVEVQAQTNTWRGSDCASIPSGWIQICHDSETRKPRFWDFLRRNELDLPYDLCACSGYVCKLINM